MKSWIEKYFVCLTVSWMGLTDAILDGLLLGLPDRYLVLRWLFTRFL